MADQNPPCHSHRQENRNQVHRRAPISIRPDQEVQPRDFESESRGENHERLYRGGSLPSEKEAVARGAFSGGCAGSRRCDRFAVPRWGGLGHRRCGAVRLSQRRYGGEASFRCAVSRSVGRDGSQHRSLAV